MMRLAIIAAICGSVLVPGSVLLAAQEPAAFFEQIAPIFERRCFSCHNDRDRKGGLSLESAEALGKGGDSGEVVWAGDPESSYLLELIVPVDGRAAMPKNADPLTAAEIEAVRRWIASGAQWPPEVKLSAARVTDTDWWSLRPLVRPAVPDPPQDVLVRNPIDAFVADKHRELGLAFSPEADRRTLIRRLVFDLTGLPPTPEEVEAFVADTTSDAYERLVDRLLSSPRYGERWARHWLDVVHFGETHGYDKDKPRPNAWPYRDYVIRSLNDDKPYGRFLAEQIAGDVLFPGTSDGIEALGFIAAGPWDLIGHAEVPETKLDGRIARHLDRDDMVQNTIMTFNSLTVGCAQCHHHKFDPITQEDYYGLQAVFAALDRADRPFDPDPETAVQRQRLAERRRILTEQQKDSGSTNPGTCRSRTAESGPRDCRRQQARRSGASGTRLSQPGRNRGGSGKVGSSGFGPAAGDRAHRNHRLPRRLRRDRCGIRVSGAVQDRSGRRCRVQGRVRLLVDRTEADFPNPGTAPVRDDVKFTARFVRVTATRLAERQRDYIFALSELKLLDAAGNNVALDRPVTASDSIEAPVRWRKQNLVDGIYPGSSGSAEELALLTARRSAWLEEKVDAATREALARNASEQAALEQAWKQLPPQRFVYAGMVHTGSGAFRGTGADGGRPRTIHVLARGDITSPGEEADREH
jgi:mono/diheme cytochrome c family protein